MLLHALRSLRNNRGFAAAAAVSIALAVGANTAIFSLVNAFWFRRLPVSAPDRIVVPYFPIATSTSGELADHYPARHRERLETLSAFKAVTYEVNATGLFGDFAPIVRVTADGPPLRAAAVAHDYFRTLGIPVRGRDFAQSDDQFGVPAAAIVSHQFWRTHFGGRSEISGAVVETTRGPLPVIGVAQPGFGSARLGNPADLWITIGALGQYSDIASHADVQRLIPVVVYARLADGETLASAQAQIRTVLDRRATLRSLRDVAFKLQSEQDVKSHRRLLGVLWAAAVLMLVLGAVNLASLLMARAEARRHELAIRLSIGATRAQLLHVVCIEALLLLIAGLAIGLIMASAILRTLGGIKLPIGLAVEDLELGPDWQVLLFALAVALVTTAAASASALRQAAKTSLTAVLASSNPTQSSVLPSRQILLVAHVGLAVFLLSCAAGLVASVKGALEVPSGFIRDELLFLHVRPRLAQYMTGPNDDSERRWADYASLIDRLRALPGVSRVAYGDHIITLFDSANAAPVRVLGVGPGYLTAIGARFLDGRDFVDEDEARAITPRDVMMARVHSIRTGGAYRRPAGRPAAVVDAAFAKKHWSTDRAVGQKYTYEPLGITYDIVGVVDPIRRTTRKTGNDSIFVSEPLKQDDGTTGLKLVVRAAANPTELRPVVLSVVRNSFPDAGMLQCLTGGEIAAFERSQERMGARFFAWFGGASAGLALIGVAGLISFVIARSRRELGVRAALGATTASLRWLAAGRAVLPGFVGVLAGVGVAVVVLKMVNSRFPDIGTAGAAPALMTGTFVCAALLVVGGVATAAIKSITPADLLRTD